MLSPHPSKASMNDLLTSPWFILAGDFIFHFLLNSLDTPILHSYSTQVLQWSTTTPIPELIKFCILFPCYLLFYLFFRHIIILLLAIPFALCNYIYSRLPLCLRNHLSILSYRAPLNLFPPNEPALTLTPFTILNRSLSAITVLLRHPPLYWSFFVFPALFLVRGNNLWYLSQLDDECIPCTGLLLPGQMKYIVAYSLMPVFGWLMVRGIFGIHWEHGMKDTVYDWWKGLRTSAWVSAHGTVVVTVVVVMRWGVLTVHHGLTGIAAPFVDSCVDGAHRGGI
ncbi:hypothetical protein FPQ18DRAFT_406100 [Pyronema domesticum]|nr:hypothetical protein FPQ18DRAFT_406100 [Pyronema domesticum]